MTLHYRPDGPDGAPVLVLGSSLGTSLEMWTPQVAPPSGRLRVLRYDRCGHGRTPFTGGPLTIDGLGRDMLALLDELRLERISFCSRDCGATHVVVERAANIANVERPERVTTALLAHVTEEVR
jgi:3-oxoadipate enol-lactonase